MPTGGPAVLMIFILTSFLACCHWHCPLDSLDAHEQLGLVKGKASESGSGNETSDQVQQVFWCTVHPIVHNVHPLDKMSSCTRRIRLAGFGKSCCRSLCCTFMSSQSCHQYECFSIIENCTRESLCKRSTYGTSAINHAFLVFVIW